MLSEYRNLLYCILFLVLSYVVLKQTVGSYTSVEHAILSMLRLVPTDDSYRNAHIYHNRYCVRHYPKNNVYGYVSVIRQMRWIMKMSEVVIEKEGPLIFYDERFLWHSLSLNGCKYRCRLSKNFSDYRSAILAVFTRNPPAEALPKPDNQTWALESGESPFHMPRISAHFRQHFKIFLTTNGESHVPWVYAVFMANQQPETVIPQKEQIRMLNRDNRQWLPEVHAQRKKKVVALISNLHPKNKRNEYIAELAKHIDIEVYGQGGRRPCSHEGETCLRNLSLQYKFFLAFENSNCVYYITEKLFRNALLFGMVPVVMGAPREYYCALAPPNSFIHVDDFSSPAELANYLHWLDQNDTAYASYFAWKAYGIVVADTGMACRLCGFVHQHINELNSLSTKGFDYFTNISRQCKVF